MAVVTPKPASDPRKNMGNNTVAIRIKIVRIEDSKKKGPTRLKASALIELEKKTKNGKWKLIRPALFVYAGDTITIE